LAGTLLRIAPGLLAILASACLFWMDDAIRGDGASMNETKPGPRPKAGDSRRGAVAGLLIAILLLAAGIWLAHDLTAASKLQDCVMSGRTNCNVIEPAR
jgi:hypothetical protein